MTVATFEEIRIQYKERKERFPLQVFLFYKYEFLLLSDEQLGNVLNFDITFEAWVSLPGRDTKEKTRILKKDVDLIQVLVQIKKEIYGQ